MVHDYARQRPEGSFPYSLKDEDQVSDDAYEEMYDWMYHALERDDWFREDIEEHADLVADSVVPGPRTVWQNRLHQAAFRAAMRAANDYFDQHPDMRETYFNERALSQGQVD